MANTKLRGRIMFTNILHKILDNITKYHYNHKTDSIIAFQRFQISAYRDLLMDYYRRDPNMLWSPAPFPMLGKHIIRP